MKKMTLEQIAKIATPIDESTMNNEMLSRIINKYPFLSQEFNKLVDEKFIKQSEEKGIYFIINIRKKTYNRTYIPEIRIKYVMKEELPTVCVYI